MSVRQDLTYKWAEDNGQIVVTRTVVGDASGKLDLAIPAGSANLPAAFSIVRATLRRLFLVCDQAITLVAGGVDAVQRITMTGPPTAGTFTLTKGVATSAAIAWNATAAQVKTALEAMSTIGVGNVLCTGGPLPGTPVDWEFVGALAVQPVTTMTRTDTLTGGTSAVSSVTTGVVPDTTIPILANLPLEWDSQGYYAQPLLADVATFRATNASGVDATLKVRTLSLAS
jgi:hypothetical protein